MKKFMTVLLSIIMFFCIGLLVLSFTVKDVIVSTLNSSMVVKEVSNQVTDVVYKYVPDVSDEALVRIEEEIATNPEVKAIADKYFDGIVDSIVNDTDVNAPDTREELETLINDNIDTLNEMNITITDEQKEEIINKLEDSKVIETVYTTVSHSIKVGLTDEQKTAISIYKFLSSNTFKFILAGIIIASLVVICLLKKSIYKWMINVSPSLIIIGLFIIIIVPMAVDKIGYMLTNKLIGRSSDIDISVLTDWGIAYLIIGVVLTIVYIIIKNVCKEDE